MALEAFNRLYARGQEAAAFRRALQSWTGTASPSAYGFLLQHASELPVDVAIGMVEQRSLPEESSPTPLLRHVVELLQQQVAPGYLLRLAVAAATSNVPAHLWIHEIVLPLRGKLAAHEWYRLVDEARGDRVFNALQGWVPPTPDLRRRRARMGISTESEKVRPEPFVVSLLECATNRREVLRIASEAAPVSLLVQLHDHEPAAFTEEALRDAIEKRRAGTRPFGVCLPPHGVRMPGWCLVRLAGEFTEDEAVELRKSLFPDTFDGSFSGWSESLETERSEFNELVQLPEFDELVETQSGYVKEPTRADLFEFTLCRFRMAVSCMPALPGPDRWIAMLGLLFLRRPGSWEREGLALLRACLELGKGFPAGVFEYGAVPLPGESAVEWKKRRVGSLQRAHDAAAKVLLGRAEELLEAGELDRARRVLEAMTEIEPSQFITKSLHRLGKRHAAVLDEGCLELLRDLDKLARGGDRQPAADGICEAYRGLSEGAP